MSRCGGTTLTVEMDSPFLPLGEPRGLNSRIHDTFLHEHGPTAVDLGKVGAESSIGTACFCIDSA